MRFTLTEAERDEVIEASHPSRPDREALLTATVERIVAARLGDAVSEGWASYAAEQERHAETIAVAERHKDALFERGERWKARCELAEARLSPDA